MVVAMKVKKSGRESRVDRTIVRHKGEASQMNDIPSIFNDWLKKESDVPLLCVCSRSERLKLQKKVVRYIWYENRYIINNTNPCTRYRPTAAIVPPGMTCLLPKTFPNSTKQKNTSNAT